MSGLLMFGGTVRSPALRHEIPAAILDPVLFAEVDGSRYVLASFLWTDQVAEALPEAKVLDYFDFGYRQLVADGLSDTEAEREAVARAVREIGIAAAVVPADFPLALAEHLRAAGIELTVDEEAVFDRRRAKSAAELAGIRAAQRAAEAGLAAARELLFSSAPDGDGRLAIDGAPLLAEDVRAALRAACAAAGAPCPPDIMVTSVWQGTGHDPGSGPLPAGLPIVIDLWPMDETSGCWADMARTFVVGDPVAEHADEIARRDRLVRAALEEARDAIRPGVAGRDLHALVCDRFEAAGYDTPRTAPDSDDGFQFALGHGVGLEVHEPPLLSLAGREPLVEGDVLAMEPGLYDRAVGGVRLEDMVLVTADGCETLTQFPYELTP